MRTPQFLKKTSSMNVLKSHLVLVLYLLIFSPALLNDYAWSDDFPALESPKSVGEHAKLDARPVYGIAITSIFELAQTTSNLKWVRLLTICGMYILATWIQRYLDEVAKIRQLNLAILAGFCCAPWANVVFWAIAFIVPWAALFACLGIKFLNSGKLRERFLGIALLTLAWLSYPPAVFLTLAVAYLRDLLMNKPVLNLFRNQLRHFFLLSISALPAFLIAKALTEVVTDEGLNSRISIVRFDALPEKIVFFLTRQVTQSLRPFSLSTSSELLIAFQASLVIAILSYLFRLNSKRAGIALGHLLVFMVVLVAIQSPHLITTQNQIEVRYFLASNWLVVVTIMILFRKAGARDDKDIFAITNLYQLRRKDAFAVGIFAIVSIVPLFFFYSIVSPITKETRIFIVRNMKECSNLEVGNSVVLERRSPWPARANLGMASQVTDLASPWVPGNAIKIFVREIRQIETDVQFLSETIEFDQNGVCTFDLEKYKQNANGRG